MHRQNIVRLLLGKENKVNFIGKLKKIGSKKNKENNVPRKEKKVIKKEAEEQQKEREIG